VPAWVFYQTRLPEARAAIARAVALAPARLAYRLRLAEVEAAIDRPLLS